MARKRGASPLLLLKITSRSGRGIRRGILNVGLARIVHHVRSCLQHNRCGGNHPLFEGCELGVSHVGQSFRYRISRKMQIQTLRRAAITAV
jgi:hypothetical protein